MPNRADDCILVIFGASGDLTRRKLLPAIYNLAETGLLPERFAIVGVARPNTTETDYRRQMRERVTDAEGEPLEPEKWTRIEERLHYVSGEFHDDQLYRSLGALLTDLGARYSIPPNYLFYFAIPPDLFPTVPIDWRHQALRVKSCEAGLHIGWVAPRRVVSLRYDLSRRRRSHAAHRWIRESQIYRIDPLGKEPSKICRSVCERIFSRSEPALFLRADDRRRRMASDPRRVLRQGRALRNIVQNTFQLLTLGPCAADLIRAEVARQKVKVLLRASLRRRLLSRIAPVHVRGTKGSQHRPDSRPNVRRDAST